MRIRGVILLFGALLVVAPSAAQDPAADYDTEAARALFRAGVSYSDTKQWALASDRFRRSMALKPSPVVAFNLSAALVHLDQLVEASEWLRGVLRDTEPSAEIHKLARQLLATAVARTGRLTVVMDEEPDETVTVHVDRYALAGREMGQARPIDPGRHVLNVYRKDERVLSLEVDILQGAQEQVQLSLPAPATQETADAAEALRQAQAAAAASVEVPRPADRLRPAARSPWLWIGTGAAVVASVVAGIVVASSAGNSR